MSMFNRAARAVELVEDVQAAQVSRAAWTMPSGSTIANIPSDIAAAFGINQTSDRVTRDQAMSIPAVRRARNLICGSVSGLPLVALRTTPDGTIERLARPLLLQPCPDVTRSWIVSWLCDDLFYYGVSWLRVRDRDATGYPQSVDRVSVDRVHVDVTQSQAYVDGKPVASADLIRFDSLDGGLLRDSRTLKTALLLEEAVKRNSTGLPPQDLLRLAEGAGELGDDEIETLLTDWEQARAAHSTAYINRSVEYSQTGFNPKDGQLAEARAYMATEIARLTNVSASDLDAPGAGSNTYANLQQAHQERLDTSLAPYVHAIEERLSFNDVCPRSQIVKCDTTAYLRADFVALVSAAKTALEAGLFTVDELRHDLFDRGPIDTPSPEAPA
jgi:HK97 family phage portal protein